MVRYTGKYNLLILSTRNTNFKITELKTFRIDGRFIIHAFKQYDVYLFLHSFNVYRKVKHFNGKRV